MDKQLEQHAENVQHTSKKDHLLPIAEIFTSVHGEGTWSGTRMTFIRLAGCSVGKASTDRHISPFPIFHPNGVPAHICTAWNGVHFTCDTDFNLNQWLSMEDIIDRVREDGVNHICLTGGEPLIHLERLRFVGFFTLLHNVMIHIETSGTIDFPIPMHKHNVWITVSPKLGHIPHMVNIANEVRLLIGPDFDSAKLPHAVHHHDNVFVSPINEIDEIAKNPDTLNRCLTLLKAHPSWRLSAQVHKVYGLR